MTATIGAPPGAARLTWTARGRGRIEVFEHHGGSAVLGLLQLRPDGGALLVNRHLLGEPGVRVMVGWALALAGYEQDGWYALLQDEVT